MEKIFQKTLYKVKKVCYNYSINGMGGERMNYIDRIKKIKNDKKITNDKLSELTGIPLSTLSKIMAGISDSPKLANIVSIADALGCSLDYIVNGTPENHNNCTLAEDELALIDTYRKLDAHSKELVAMVANKEAQRAAVASAVTTSARKERVAKTAKILPTLNSASGFAKRSILLYDLSVSAGTGVDLDDAETEEIMIPENEKTRIADFALRINGNSMEPKYHDDDIVLVEDVDAVEVGELGIFVLDGNGYFKKFGGDRLISLNEDYGDILLDGYTEVVCCGRVVGKLKKRI